MKEILVRLYYQSKILRLIEMNVIFFKNPIKTNIPNIKSSQVNKGSISSPGTEPLIFFVVKDIGLLFCNDFVLVWLVLHQHN